MDPPQAATRFVTFTFLRRIPGSSLKYSVKKELAVALGAEDGGFDHISVGAAKDEQRFADFFNGSGLGAGVADDSSFSDVLASGFKLRFDQDDETAAGTWFRFTGECGGDDGGQNERGGNKGNVHGDEIYGFSDLFAREIAGIGFFQQSHAGVLAQAVINLAVTRIYGDDASCAVLKQAVGETTGRGADIKADFACDVDGPVLDSSF